MIDFALMGEESAWLYLLNFNKILKVYYNFNLHLRTKLLILSLLLVFDFKPTTSNKEPATRNPTGVARHAHLPRGG